MTSQIQQVRDHVESLYSSQQPSRDKVADWLYPHHVLIVAEKARELATKYNADVGMCEAAALLHDIADAVMGRHDDGHEQKSLVMAREILTECGYDDEQISLLVDDALRYHGCRGAERPESIEGKVLATADAYAHIRTDFYMFAIHMLSARMTLDETKAWLRQKLERDYKSKVLFDDERAAWKSDYEFFREFFAR